MTTKNEITGDSLITRASSEAGIVLECITKQREDEIES